MSIKPHKVKETLSVNNARSNISLLTKPLAEITRNIYENINLCNIQKQKIQECEGDIEKLIDNLFIPMRDIISRPLDKPITVCGESECCIKRRIHGIEKFHYKQLCHSPCFLKFDDHNIIGI